MRRLKLCYLKSSSITQLFLDVFIYNIFKYVSSILNIITVTVSKIVQKHLGNIITGLSRNKNATRVHSEVLQVAISPKFKVRDRIMKIRLIIWKKINKFFLVCIYRWYGNRYECGRAAYSASSCYLTSSSSSKWHRYYFSADQLSWYFILF